MLKRIMKAGLIAAMIASGAGMAVAQDGPLADAHGLKPVVADSYVKVNARYGQYFGQFNPGKEGSSAFFRNVGETGVQFSGGVGNARFFIDHEIRSDGLSATDDSNEFYDVIARASYVTPIGFVTIGKVTNYMAQTGLNPGGGIKMSNGGFGAQAVSTIAGNTESDGIDLLLPLMDKKLILEFTMWDKAYVKARIEDPAKGAFGQTNYAGTTQAAGVRFKTGLVTLQTGITNETMDDPAIDTDTSETNTYNHFSIMAEFGDMAVNASSIAADIKAIDKSVIKLMTDAIAALPSGNPVADYGLDILGANKSEFKVAGIGVGFTMKNLGPGKLNLNYETYKLEDTIPSGADVTVPAALTSAMGVLAPTVTAAVLDNFSMSREIVKMNMMYSIDISPKIGYQLLYDSKTTTPTAGAQKDEGITETFIGAGLYGYF
ncbi:MAG: hypothetical protein H8E81_01615 [Deltaproteobacteria bacterium]|nr:hypothetical protein [Deltaproteobacteria bacterium]